MRWVFGLERIIVPLLYYWRWKNYRWDLDMGAGFHLNQGNPLLHEIPLGDSLCPSHHVAVHRCNAPLDYGELAFVFTNHREPLKYNTHLQMSA